MAVELPSGAHGGDGLRVARSLGLDPAQIIDLSASLNPFAPNVAELAAEVLRADPGALSRYPDPAAATEAMADALEVDAGRLVLTNGGAEAIALLAAAQSIGWVEDPEFSLYRRHLGEVRRGAARWRSNPSNPLGALAGPDERAAVWDEAFYPLATGRWSRGDDTSWRLGSLTKLWSCPGLRLGYAIAPEAAAAEALRARQPQWSVNGLALALVTPLLAVTELASWCGALALRRASLAGSLRTIGYVVRETAANWLLVDAPFDLRGALAPAGVVVRDCAGFGMAGTFRVALPATHQLDRIVAAFAAAAR